MKLILGSQSPRRKEILGYFSLPFEQVTPPFDEEAVPFSGNPEEYVTTLSQGKAASLAAQFPGAVILTADTIVFREGKIYGKPKSREVAVACLMELVGNWHTVYTGVTVQKGKEVLSEVEAAHVLFNPLTPEEVEKYVAMTQWQDKAGGYAIQMAGGIIVRKIDGCYTNVMGLPLNTTGSLLKKVGIFLLDHLSS